MKCQHCGADNADDARFCGACGRATSATEPSRAGSAAIASSAPDLAGREIAGRYRIYAKLGEGGMGAVYRGEQMSLKRKVAIKLLRPELSADPGLVRRFNAEAELVAKLSHPNTVSIFDFGQDRDGTLFIAMEYLEGRSLRQVITTEGPMPARRALHVLAQVAASLADAHGHGIVHRDLKPDNVMLTARGREQDVVRVLDFGIAKVRDEQKGATVNPMTQAGDLVGTPQYMAPEQIRAEHVDGRTDVYALGAILYEVITGRMPFEGPSLMVILSRHLMDPPEPPTRRRPDLPIPPALDALVLEMLAKDPAQRPPSMEAVIERFAAIALSLGATTPHAAMGSPWAPSSTGGPLAAVPTPASGAGGRALSRPPGVPQTYPPGAMMAPPAATAPAVPLHPPAAAPAPAPVAHVAPHGHAPPMPPALATAAPTAGPLPVMPAMPPGAAHAAMHGGGGALAPAPRGKASVPLLIAGGLVLVAGIGVAVFLAQKDDRARGASAASPGTAAAPATAASPGLPPPAAPARGGALAGDVRDVGASWQVQLPLGFILNGEQNDGGARFGSYSGTIGGDVVKITTVAAPEDMSGKPRSEYDDGCGDIARNFFSGAMVGSRMVSGRGAQVYRCTISAADNTVVEGAIFTGRGSTLVVFFQAPAYAFDRLVDARDELFDRRVRAP